MESCCICGTVKNCEPYLKNVFKNIKKITKLFKDYYIIIYYDTSTDNTLEILNKYKEKNKKIYIYHNNIYYSKYRTHRLAFGRNFCLNIIKSKFADFKYFIMMDFDDVSSNNINISVLEKHIINDKLWDALSFNKSTYYDLWALSVSPYVVSYAHFQNYTNVVNEMQKYITNKLNTMDKNSLLPCYSAFNGFSIYKTNIFINCVYDGNMRLDLIPEQYITDTIRRNKSNIVFNNKLSWLSSKNEDCEHRSFHFDAINKYNANIYISPEILF